MYRVRLGIVTALLWVCGSAGAQAAREPVPLNDYTRLGQRLTAERPCSGVWATVPSWSDAEGGLTFTLWDSPQRTKQLAQKAFKDVQDNARLELRVTKPLPAGSYYWEIDQRTGQTRIGLYCDLLDAETDDCAYLDGKPDRKRRFLSGMIGAPLVYRTVPQLLAMLRSGKVDEQAEACRQLAAVGTPAAVPALAALLEDERLSHMARLALEPMPGAGVDAAFRDALGKLKGRLLAGVINSIGVRRDGKAVAPLGKLLRDPDVVVASAAAVALGRIGTPAAADLLETALTPVAPALRPALLGGRLECAQALAGSGQRDRAAALFDRLRGQEMPAGIREAAMRGAIVARGAAGLPLLLEQLRSADAAMAGAALWVAARELPGARVSEALAAELGKLPAERQAALVQVLGQRGDRAALPMLVEAAVSGDKPVRLAALRALPGFDGASAAPAVVRALADPDPEVVRTAQGILAGLPGAAVSSVVLALLDSPDAGTRLAGIEVARKQRLRQAVPALLKAVREGDAPTRLAALKALRELAGTQEVPALMDLLAGAGDAERDAAEQALAAACARVSEPEACAERLVARLAQASPAHRAALTRVLAILGGAKALQAVRQVLGDADAGVRTAALEALCEWKTPDAAPDLIRLAQSAGAPADRLRSLCGCLRMAGDPDVPADRRLSLCRDAAPLVQRDEERKLLLGALGGLASADALPLIAPHLDSATTREEASIAVVAIAAKLAAGPDAPKAIPALEKVARVSGSPDLVKRAQALLKDAQARAGAK